MLVALLWMNSCWRGRLGLDSPARSTRSPAHRPDAILDVHDRLQALLNALHPS